jgi:hypothetical protein
LAQNTPDGDGRIQQTVSGLVFEDDNGNGRRDPEELGLAGIAVSNGLDVVVTDKDGRYSVPLAAGDILFLSKPGSHALPVNNDQIPQFYYIHDPDGTPSELPLRFPAVPPSGPLPDSIDFPLLPIAEPENYKAIFFADPQPQSPAELNYLRDEVIAELQGSTAAFGITLGDVMFDDLSLFPRYNRLLGTIGVPWFNVPGNHDLNFLSPDDRYSLETFRRYFGPPYYSFSYGRVHFVVLDDVDYLGRNNGVEQPGPSGAGRYEGRIDQRQLDWLVNDLALVPDEDPVVVVMHIPLLSATSDTLAVNVANRRELLVRLSGRDNLLLLAGHLHKTEQHRLGEEEGYGGAQPVLLHALSAVSGGWWSGPLDARGIPEATQLDGAPNGYYIMSVEGREVRLRFKAAGKPAAHQMDVSISPVFKHATTGGAGTRAVQLAPLPGSRLGAMEVVVNFFEGGPNSTVVARIDGAAPIELIRSPRFPPLFAWLVTRVEDRKAIWTGPQRTAHIWAMPLPDDLAAGVHSLVVEATDSYGQTHSSRTLFEVTLAE